MRYQNRGHGLFSQIIRSRRAIVPSALAATLLILAAACGGDDDKGDDGTGGPTPAATLTKAPEAPTAEPSVTESAPLPTESPQSPAPGATAGPVEGGVEPVSGRGDGGWAPFLLVEVRTGRHPDFDRVTFEFVGGLPAYRVEYVEPPIRLDASGMETAVAGEAFLQVRFEGARAHDDDGNPTISEREMMPGLETLQELEQTGDFEAVLTWVIGVPAQLGFRVEQLTEPNRLVIDVAHP